LSKEENEKYQAALASAHDHFRAGRYGRAIVEYSDIDKVYGDRVEGGMPLYWIARCWINLKEYNTARQQLADFLKQNPGSPWSPRAKLELARVEWKLGLGETALQRFREIIQQHPYEDAAEMAKMELQNLDKSL
jgi:TolA-binding protein